MTYPTKWFSDKMEGAPSMSSVGLGSADFSVNSSTNDYQNNFAPGELAEWLKACLVNGFTPRTASSVTYDSGAGTATLDFGTSHKFYRYSIVLVEGANESAYNGEHEVIEITANTITVALPAPPAATPATGTITVKVAPAGWTIDYDSGTGIVVFGRPASDATPYKLYIDNSYNFQGTRRSEAPFSTAAGGFFPWAMCKVIDNYVDETTFDTVWSFPLACVKCSYTTTWWGRPSSENYQNDSQFEMYMIADPYAFWQLQPLDYDGFRRTAFIGDIVSARPGDRGHFMVAVPTNWTSQASQSSTVFPQELWRDNWPTGSEIYADHPILATNYAGTPGHVYCIACYPFSVQQSTEQPGGLVEYPNPANGGFILSREPAMIIEQAASKSTDTSQNRHVARGYLPGMVFSPQSSPQLDNRVVAGLPGFGDEKVLMLLCHDAGSSTNDFWSLFTFRLGQWRDLAL